MYKNSIIAVSIIATTCIATAGESNSHKHDKKDHEPIVQLGPRPFYLVELNERLGVKHTPELKGGDPARIAAVFGSQANYAQRMIDELKDADVDPRDVWAQSFNVDDILYWIQNEPRGGNNAGTSTRRRRQSPQHSTGAAASDEIQKGTPVKEKPDHQHPPAIAAADGYRVNDQVLACDEAEHGVVSGVLATVCAAYEASNVPKSPSHVTR
jgi:hypothetical protein